MSPITHLLAGWVAGQCAELDRRDRAWVTVAGVIPDIDGLGLIAEIATRGSTHPLNWWSEYHHVLGHNLLFGTVVTIAAAVCARRRLICSLLVCVSFHLHLFCDLIGARGPDGYQWPIPYFAPFSRDTGWVWSGQWALNAWQNMVLTACLLLISLILAHRRGSSPVELFSTRASEILVDTLRKRFPPAR